MTLPRTNLHKTDWIFVGLFACLFLGCLALAGLYLSFHGWTRAFAAWWLLLAFWNGRMLRLVIREGTELNDEIDALKARARALDEQFYEQFSDYQRRKSLH